MQQSSNTTYRIYDWDRVDARGVPRELHLEAAQQVMHRKAEQSAKCEAVSLKSDSFGNIDLILESSYFRMERWVLHGEAEDPRDPSTFRMLFCADGALTLSTDDMDMELAAGQSCLLPACLAGIRYLPHERAEVLRVTLPSG